jgi:hypothetical protein
LLYLQQHLHLLQKLLRKSGEQENVPAHNTHFLAEQGRTGAAFLTDFCLLTDPNSQLINSMAQQENFGYK